MNLPKDVRDLAGTTSWQHSRGTTDPPLATWRWATYPAFYRAKIIVFPPV